MMKKTTLFILMITIILAFAGCGGSEVTVKEYESASSDTAAESASSDSNTIQAAQAHSTSVTSQKDLINEFISQVLGSYTDCEVTTLTIFDAHDAEAPGTYDCRGIITFNGNDSADVAGTLIQSYSNNLAEKLDRYYPSLASMELIWMAPEFHGRATLNYEKVKGFLQITSTSSNSNFALDVDIEELTEETVEQAGAMSTDPIQQDSSN